VKLTLLQRCLCGSLFLHSAMVGVAALAGFTLQRAAPRTENDPPILTLIAAPPMAAESASPELAAIAPAPIQPVTLEPLEVRSAEPPAPVVPIAEPLLPVPAQSKPIQPASAPVEVAPVAGSSLPASAHGDGSSAKAGLDVTTVVGKPGVRSKPNYLKNLEPQYPLLARRRGQEGLVVVTVKVTVEGRVANVALKESSGFPLLDDAALEAVREGEFEPARIGSRAVETEIEVPVRFKLSR
jgi:protein TonB